MPLFCVDGVALNLAPPDTGTVIFPYFKLLAIKARALLIIMLLWLITFNLINSPTQCVHLLFVSHVTKGREEILVFRQRRPHLKRFTCNLLLGQTDLFRLKLILETLSF